MITIIDYETGNPASVYTMLRKIGAEVQVSSLVQDIEKADKLILPGVGSFDFGMENLRHKCLIEVLNEKVLRQRTPILGICLGMQLMTRKSEEGGAAGLGWIEAETKRFYFDGLEQNLKIPHMGWNTIHGEKDSTLLEGLYDKNKFYFVHSYHVVCDHYEDVLSTTAHGIDFVSSFQKENIFGVQFHPEKSHKYGMALLENFTRILC